MLWRLPNTHAINEILNQKHRNPVLLLFNNDLGFVIQKRHLVMSECQSTINWNIPMRCLGYVSRSLENLSGKEGLYGSKLVKFPVPEFYLFLFRHRNKNNYPDISVIPMF